MNEVIENRYSTSNGDKVKKNYYTGTSAEQTTAAEGW
ncbi:hypothetical protein T06_11809 [Trichinella sp. T6]|nr:hypothetical protein T06_11809 [Trichinella sp. T6]